MDYTLADFIASNSNGIYTSSKKISDILYEIHDNNMIDYIISGDNTSSFIVQKITSLLQNTFFIEQRQVIPVICDIDVSCIEELELHCSHLGQIVVQRTCCENSCSAEFGVVKSLLEKSNTCEYKTCDIVLLQALIHENYISCDDDLDRASNVISLGDVFHTQLYRNQSWELLEELYWISCKSPIDYMLPHQKSDINYCTVWTKISTMKSRFKSAADISNKFGFLCLEDLLEYRRETLQKIIDKDFQAVHMREVYTLPLLTSIIKVQDDYLRDSIKQSMKTSFIKYCKSVPAA